MANMKRFLEDLSVEMGLDGEITEAVIEEGQKRLDSQKKNEYLGWTNGMKDDSPEYKAIEKCWSKGHHLDGSLKQINKGRCWTYYVCDKCKIEYQSDSSDCT